MIHPLLCNAKPNFYPRSPCGERHRVPPAESTSESISIHALLAESDVRVYELVWGVSISIHALLAESDRREGPRRQGLSEFLSTLSLRRATLFALLRDLLHHDFYPRSPCGERPLETICCWRCNGYFYPRSPCGERRLFFCSMINTNIISIHALLAESDMYHRVDRETACISIHALLAESDYIHPYSFPFNQYFYPRSPCGERPIKGKPASPVIGISIHALLAESDLNAHLYYHSRGLFLSTLSLRRATSLKGS